MKRDEPKNINENNILYYRNVTSFLLLTLFLGLALIPELAINYFFKDELKVQPSKLTRLLTISRFPWVINPIFGMITDFYPIFGYKKNLYFILWINFLFSLVDFRSFKN